MASIKYLLDRYFCDMWFKCGNKKDHLFRWCSHMVRWILWWNYPMMKHGRRLGVTIPSTVHSQKLKSHRQGLWFVWPKKTPKMNTRILYVNNFTSWLTPCWLIMHLVFSIPICAGWRGVTRDEVSIRHSVTVCERRPRLQANGTDE
jgi:hypothetical protein